MRAAYVREGSVECTVELPRGACFVLQRGSLCFVCGFECKSNFRSGIN